MQVNDQGDLRNYLKKKKKHSEKVFGLGDYPKIQMPVRATKRVVLKIFQSGFLENFRYFLFLR